MAAGTYALVVERTASGAVEVGALGAVSLPAGWYAYVGSAFGPGTSITCWATRPRDWTPW